MNKNDFTVEIIHDFDSILSKRNELDSFFDQFEKPSFFFELDWLATWNSNFGNDCNYLFILIRKDVKLVAFIPFCIRGVQRYGFKYNLLEIVASNRAGWTDLLCTDKSGKVYDLLADAIFQHKNMWDIAIIQRLQNIIDIEKFCEILKLRNNHYALIKMGKLFGINKYDSFTAYFKSRKSKIRENYLRYKRRIENAGKFEMLTSEQLTPSEVLNYITAICKQSWQGKMNDSIFSEKNIISHFHTDIIMKKHKRISYLAFILKFEGVPIAYRYGIRLNNSYTSYSTEFDNTYRQYSPGVVSHYTSIEYLMSNNITNIDFGIGEGQLKSETTDWKVDLYTIYIFNDNAKSKILKLLRQLNIYYSKLVKK